MADRGLSNIAGAVADTLNERYRRALAEEERQVAISRMIAQQRFEERLKQDEQRFKAEESVKEYERKTVLQDDEQLEARHILERKIEAGIYEKNPWLSMSARLKLRPEDKLIFDTSALQYKEAFDAISGPNALMIDDVDRKYYRDIINRSRLKMRMLLEKQNPEFMKRFDKRYEDIFGEKPKRRIERNGLREQAIQYLKDNDQPVVEENIQYIINQLKK